MRTSPEKKWLAIAWRAVKAGEKELLRRFSLTTSSSLKFKAHKEIVTDADLASNRAIQKVLKKLTPRIPVLSEEGGGIDLKRALKADLVWILDPLDGTTNYTLRLPLWGISLALVQRGEPILGAISLPVLRARFHATRNGGAWMGRARLHTSKITRLADATGLLCFGYTKKDMKRGIDSNRAFNTASRNTRRLGSAVIESAWMAMGHADYSVLHGVHPWDVAAGALIVREAGGDVVTSKGKRWTLTDSDIIFSAPGVTKQVMKRLP